MSIKTAIDSISNHIEDIYDTLELGGEDLTNKDKNINNIYTNIKNRYKDYLANGTDII